VVKRRINVAGSEDVMKRLSGLAWLALLMSLPVGASATAQTLDKVKVVIPENSVFVLNWMGARDAGIFRKHGIDLEVDTRPFAGYLAALPAKQCLVTTYSGIDAVLKMNQGFDLAVIGGGLTVIQDIFVLKESPIKTVSDLRGKRLGVWSTGAGAFKAARAAIIDAAGLDIMKDTKMVQLAPPALLKTLENGSVDAMINISSFTLEAASRPDKFRSIFAPNEYWKTKSGYPIVWAAPLVAWKSWIDENPARAEHFAAATEESFRWLREPENLDAAVAKYGTLAGVTTSATAATYKRWFAEKRIFLAGWDQKVVDAEWQFLGMAKRNGVLDEVPAKEKHALMIGDGKS
jgi:ABC-type nitrate/sulfonate/bicarbonate transport system substrate-binding protein